MENEKVNNNEEVKESEMNDLELCKKERDEYLEGWKRAKADLANYQNNETKRIEELAKFGSIVLIRDLILVLDSFDLALIKSNKEEDEKGMHMIRSQLLDVLEKQGLENIEVNPGVVFDPNFHEAVGEIESDEEPGTIAMCVEQGYSLHGRVVRAARVQLSKEKII